MRSCVVIGAVESSGVALTALVAHGFTIGLAITVPDDRAGMHSDYHDLAGQAERLGIRVMRTLNVNSAAAIAAIRAASPDVIFVVGWSRLCGPELLAAARHGVIGYHPAKLPRMRGRAALAWTILLDCKETAGSLFWMDEGTDSGELAAQEVFAVPSRVDLPTLYALHMDALRRMLDRLLPQLRAGQIPRTEQDQAQATYLAGRTVDDGVIEWQRPAVEIDRLVRAVTQPYPGAFTSWNGRRLTIWASDVVARPQWIAQVGQVFAYEEGAPLVRCGDGTTLKLTRYEIVADGTDTVPALKGQPVLGRNMA